MTTRHHAETIEREENNREWARLRRLRKAVLIAKPFLIPISIENEDIRRVIELAEEDTTKGE